MLRRLYKRKQEVKGIQLQELELGPKMKAILQVLMVLEKQLKIRTQMERIKRKMSIKKRNKKRNQVTKQTQHSQYWSLENSIVQFISCPMPPVLSLISDQFIRQTIGFMCRHQPVKNKTFHRKKLQTVIN